MSNLSSLFESLKKSQMQLALENGFAKDRALNEVCISIADSSMEIIAANLPDMEKARAGGMSEALLDRLFLDQKRIDSMIDGIKTIIRLENPIGKVPCGWKNPNGLLIEKITVPLGVACIIYESRPNVTVDAFALAYKAGCSILLRGSSAALESNKALVKAIKNGLKISGVPDAVELASSGKRDEVDEILNARGMIDVVLPRGGKELIRRVVDNAKIPVIETGEGNCHIYVDANYKNTENAVDIICNAKLQRPGVCNAVETVLIHKNILNEIMPLLSKNLAGKAELRCDERSKAAAGNTGNPVIKDAVQSDWETEFLDTILAVKTVDSLDEAVDHINKYGTRHSEAILTDDIRTSEEFCSRVDASCVYTNASTRFTDGGEFGFGAELGISTQKFHVRGPMGLDALTTIKYRITGQGQTRK